MLSVIIFYRFSRGDLSPAMTTFKGQLFVLFRLENKKRTDNLKLTEYPNYWEESFVVLSKF